MAQFDTQAEPHIEDRAYQKPALLEMDNWTGATKPSSKWICISRVITVHLKKLKPSTVTPWPETKRA